MARPSKVQEAVALLEAEGWVVLAATERDRVVRCLAELALDALTGADADTVRARVREARQCADVLRGKGEE